MNHFMPIHNDNGVVSQVNLEEALNALAMLNVRGFYNDATYYGIKMWIEAYMNMRNSPMPSGVRFVSPKRIHSVSFLELCRDLSDYWVEIEHIELSDIDDDQLNDMMLAQQDNMSEMSDYWTDVSSFMNEFDWEMDNEEAE